MWHVFLSAVSRGTGESMNCSCCDSLHHKSCVLNQSNGEAIDLSSWTCQVCATSPTGALNKAISLMKADIKRINEFTASTSKAVSSISAQLSEVAKLSSRVDQNTKAIEKLESSLKSTNRLCASRVGFDKSRRLVISGVPYKKGENLLGIVRDVAKVLQVELLPQSIDNCFRFRAKNESIVKPILLILTSGIVRDQLLSSFRVLKRKINGSELKFDANVTVSLGEHLSPDQHRLLTSAKDKLVKSGIVKFVWFAHNNILIKKIEGSKVITVRSEADILSISNSKT